MTVLVVKYFTYLKHAAALDRLRVRLNGILFLLLFPLWHCHRGLEATLVWHLMAVCAVANVQSIEKNCIQDWIYIGIHADRTGKNSPADAVHRVCDSTCLYCSVFTCLGHVGNERRTKHSVIAWVVSIWSTQLRPCLLSPVDVVILFCLYRAEFLLLIITCCFTTVCNLVHCGWLVAVVLL